METTTTIPTFRHKIIYYLQMNYRQYQAFEGEYFKHYCEYLSHCKNIDFDALYLNRHLKSWFETQWYAGIECEIKRQYEPLEMFEKQDIELMISMFYKENIQPFCPSVLLKMIATQKMSL